MIIYIAFFFESLIEHVTVFAFQISLRLASIEKVGRDGSNDTGLKAMNKG